MVLASSARRPPCLSLNRSVRFAVKQISQCPLLVFLLLLPLGVASQSLPAQFRTLSVKDGLSQSVVNGIAQDGDGFMWFATQNGLNRFDGYTFMTSRARSSDSTQLADDNIWRILSGRDGRIWVGTFNGGLSVFDPKTGVFTTFQHAKSDSTSLRVNNITALFEDNRGTMWVGGWDGGLSRMTTMGGKIGFIHSIHDPNDPTSISDSRVSSILEDREGNLWIGTWSGLNRMTPDGKFVRYRHVDADPNSLGGNNVWSLALDSTGTLWIGTWDGGVSRYDARLQRFQVFRAKRNDPSALSSNRIRCVYTDHGGTVWIGTYDAGLDRFDVARQRFIHERNNASAPFSLPDDEIQSLFQDASGTLWVGTASGVASIDPYRTKFGLIPLLSDGRSEHRKNIRTICVDNIGGLWYGTMGNGLWHLPSGASQFEHYRNRVDNPYSLGHDHVIDISTQRDGTVWVATRGGGVCRFDRRTKQFIRYLHDPTDPRSLGGNDIATVLEASDGMLWFGTDGRGLDRFDPKDGTFTHYRSAGADSSALIGDYVWSLFEDSRKNLWVGTWGRGLCRLDQKTHRFTWYRHVQGDATTISGSAIACIEEDPQGRVWFGTSNGLSFYSYETNRFTTFTEAGGLANRVINGLVIARNGDVWVSTNRGLSRFDVRSRSFKNFEASDGLQGIDFDQGAYASDALGRMYFGGKGGINLFHPDSIPENPIEPRIRITNVRVMEQLLPWTQFASGELVLDHDQNFLSFEYSALSFSAPERNQYAYKLEGIDQDWVQAGNRRYTSYTRLDPGEYVFRVRGSNNDGVWNTVGTAFRITIAPPYWERWWFRGLMLLTVGGFVYSMHRYRHRKKQEIERIRNKIARDLHDEVSATLSGINYFAQAITGDAKNTITPPSQRFLGLIRESVGEAQESMSDIIWSINPENDKLVDLFAKCHRFAADLFESKEIQYTIEIPPGIGNEHLTMEQRRTVWLIFKEIVANVVKHSRSASASVRFSLDRRQQLDLIVSDTGTGFDPTLPRIGNGNKNIRARVEALGGTATLESSVGAGTRWMVSIPLKR